MSKNRHPNNGPSFSAPTYENRRSGLAPSPERRKAELEQAASDAAKQRRFRQLFREDPNAWFDEYFKKPDEWVGPSQGGLFHIAVSEPAKALQERRPVTLSDGVRSRI